MISADLEAFRRDGALKFPALIAERLDRLQSLAATGPGDRLRLPGLEATIAPATEAVGQLLGRPAQPVRAVLFDKTASSNWALGWHQDRTIVVRQRCDVPGFGPWTRKQDLLHVAPPFELLAGMVTLRIHLDPCGEGNAPLKIALGSHKIGMVCARDARARACQHTVVACLAEPGDVWAYATPILHASDRAVRPTRRRVLQVDYSAEALPGGLEWVGIG